MRALIFDLDGTVIDSVYAHVVSWQRSFAVEDVHVPAWSIHTKIGLSGKELAMAIGQELGRPLWRIRPSVWISLPPEDRPCAAGEGLGAVALRLKLLAQLGHPFRRRVAAKDVPQ